MQEAKIDQKTVSHLVTHKLEDIQEMTPNEDGVLLDNNILEKGSLMIVAGAPGLGKSMVAMQLAISGVTQEPWLGVGVVRPFKTLVLQAENGLLRLHQESKKYPKCDYGDNIRVSEPPELGLRFDDPEFCQDLKGTLEEQTPDVIVIDPWNAAADRENLETVRHVLNSIRRIVGYGDAAPALVVVHHTRKPKAGPRSSGRSLLHELAGSYALSSAARSVFVLESASDSPEDDRVVWNCVKNNNGPLLDLSFWKRALGRFERIDPIVLSEGNSNAHDVALERVVNALAEKGMTRAELVAAFSGERGFSRSSVYGYVKALEKSGRCSVDKNGVISLTEEEVTEEEVTDKEVADSRPSIVVDLGTLLVSGELNEEPEAEDLSELNDERSEDADPDSEDGEAGPTGENEPGQGQLF